MPARSAASRASLWARTLKPMIGTPDASASVTSDSVMPPTPEWITRAPTSSVASFSIVPMIASSEPLHVGLDDQRQILPAGRFELAHHLLERAAHAGRAGGHLVAPLPSAVVGDLARTRFRLHHRQTIAGFRRCR
jgi:hypothetical protein